MLVGDSMLLLAMERPEDVSTALGFAVLTPLGCDEGRAKPLLEVRYLGVAPTAWGSGIARALLVEVDQAVRDTGRVGAELSVYMDNQAALAAYAKAGWRRVGVPEQHPRSGRVEVRYRRNVYPG